MINDFCGGLEEEVLRTNFILVYELIDEIIVNSMSSIIFIIMIIGLWDPSNY
jgi:hypothetical protein